MEQLRNAINEKLSYYGFSKNDNTWIRVLTQQTGGSTMAINGQVFQQPGQTIETKMIFSIVYDFDVEFLDTGFKENSICIRYQVTQNGQSIAEHETNIYADEYQLFDELCNRVFRI